MNKALFLDRDGVINKEKEYIYQIKDFEFLEGIFDTVRFFRHKSYKIIVITNQSGIARGYYTEKDYQVLNSFMLEEFRKRDLIIDAVYHCPHYPPISGPCECRKPNPGMIYKAQKKFNLDLSESIIVGDKIIDLITGINASLGYKYIVKTGHSFDEKSAKKLATQVISDLNDLIALFQ